MKPAEVRILEMRQAPTELEKADMRLALLTTLGLNIRENIADSERVLHLLNDVRVFSRR